MAEWDIEEVLASQRWTSGADCELDHQFRRIIQRADDSLRPAKTLVGLIEAPLILRRLAQYAPRELQPSADQQLELMSAIEANDGPRAHSIMHAHILTGWATYLRGRRGQ